MTFPTCVKKVMAKAPDTNCDELAAANHITKQNFIDYNDDVDANDCSGVVVGQKVRVFLL